MTPEAPGANPYVGPRTFSYEERNLFFGREREARDLLARVLSERLLLFYAQSGSGKSSLLHTRLIPQLQQDKGFVVLPVGRVSGAPPAQSTQVDNIYVFNLLLSIDEGGDPARLAHVNLADFLARLARRTIADAAGERKGWVYDASLVPTPPAGDAVSRRYALIVDQFEEIVTTSPERWHEREDFFRQLNQALQADPNLWVVLTLREDYVAALDPYAALMADHLRGRFYMERMGREAALDAIRRPAEVGGRPFAPGVAEKLVDDLRLVRTPGQSEPVAGQYVEPVQLQVVCYQLWERLQREPEGAGGTQITEADLAAAGDVDRALEQFYSETLAAVLAEPAVKQAGVSERALRTWFDRELITETGIRNTVLRNEAAGRTGTMPNAAVDVLARRFLLRTELRGGGAWVELVHDRFVEPIQSANRAWLASNQNPLTQRAAAWEQAGRAPSLLLKGDRLRDAKLQVDSRPEDFTALEREFLGACLEAERVAGAQRLRLFVAAAVLLVLVFALLALFAGVNAVRANRERTIAQNESVRADAEKLEAKAQESKAIAAGQQAEIARQKAVEEEQKAQEERQKALTLSNLANALAAGTASGVQPERSALGAVGLSQFARQLGTWQPATGIEQLERTLASLGGLPLRGHRGAVKAAAFSPGCDGSAPTPAGPCTLRLATGDDDGAIRLWDVRHPFREPVTLAGHTAAVDHVAWSPDGRWLASSAADHTVRLWDMTATPAAAQAFSVQGPLVQLAFSASGRWLATATNDGMVRVWDMSTAPQVAPPQVLEQPYVGAISAVFSRDEQRLMTASQDGFTSGEVRLWRAGDGFAQPEATFPYEYIAAATMSPDGNWLAVGTPTYLDLRYVGADAAKAADGVQRFPGFNYIYSMAFSPDSRSFSSGSHLWQLNDGGNWDAPTRLVGQPQEGVGRPVFSQDGRWLAAVSGDYTAYRWDLHDLTRQPYAYRGHEGTIHELAFSPDASLLATAGGDGAVRLWTADSPTAGPIILHQPGEQAETRLWDVSTANPALSSRLVGLRPDNYHLVAISPDGRYVAVAFESGASDVLLWDTAQPLAQPRQLQHPGAVMTMKFSPACANPAETPAARCRSRLAVGDWSGNVRLWDPGNPTADGYANVDLPQGAAVRDLAFSGDGQVLVAGTGSPDSFNQYVVNVWQLDDLAAGVGSLTPAKTLRGHTSIVRSVAVSPSGRWVLSGAWDPDFTARLWDLSTSSTEPVAILPFKGRLFTAAISPDERWAAAGSWDGTAKLVRLDDPTAPPIVLDQHLGRILSMAVSPDSHWLATGGEDQRVILWDLTAPDPSASFAVLRSPTGSGHGTHVAFSADGRWLSAFGAGEFSSQAPWLATASNDVHLYSLSLDDLVDRICLAAGRNLTDDEWRRYASGESVPAFCPEPTQNPLARRLEAQALLLDGDDRAAAGDAAAAQALYDQASNLDPAPAGAAPDAARQRVVQALVQRGRALAAAGQAGRAVQAFEQAKKLDPALAIDPKAEAQHLLADAVRQSIDQGLYAATMEQLDEFEAAIPTIAITSTLTSDEWNTLCWKGALNGQAQAVLPACERAVALAPADGEVRDSRGLARGLTGDTAGAIEDFQFFAQRAQTTGYDQNVVDQRQAWIAALQAGNNPFDAATLQALKNG